MSVRIDNANDDMFRDLTKAELITLGIKLKRAQSDLFRKHVKGSAEAFDAAMDIWYDIKPIRDEIDIAIIHYM